MNTSKPVKDMLTEADNQTYDVVRLTILMSLIVLNVLTIYVVLKEPQDWANLIGGYAAAIGVLIGSSGVGLYFKTSVELNSKGTVNVASQDSSTS